MNLEIANRLLSYRRAHGLSQEELAERLGVSRQAVSKWERAEAAPDTDNLIALAALYGVLIDELINGKDEPRVQSEQPANDKKDGSSVQFTEGGIKIEDENNCVYVGMKGVHIVEKNGGDEIHLDRNGVNISEGTTTDQNENKKKTTVEGHLIVEFDNDWLYAATAILCTIAYLVIGFCLPRGWACGWILFMLVPVIPSLFTAIAKRKSSEFLFPVFVTGLYLVAGMCYGRWHPEWIIFLTIPIYYIIADAIEDRHKKR